MFLGVKLQTQGVWMLTPVLESGFQLVLKQTFESASPFYFKQQIVSMGSS